MRTSSSPVAGRSPFQKIYRVIQNRNLPRCFPLCQRTPLALHKPLPVNRSSIRFASTSQVATAATTSLVYRIKNLLLGTSLGLFVWLGYLYVTDVRAGIHQWAVAPSLRWIYDDAEEAHEAGIESLKSLYAWGLHPRERGDEDRKGDLSVEVIHELGTNTWMTLRSASI